jgi:hypothetical protein
MEAHLPLAMDIGSIRHLTPELIQEAEKLRSELKDLPEHVVRRRIRDNLDSAKRRRIKPSLGDLGEETL